MKSPLILLAACFALGIVVAHLASPGFAAIPILFAATGFCLLGGLLCLSQNWVRSSICLALSGFVVAGLTASVSFQNRFSPNDIHNLSDWGLNIKHAVLAEGIIVSNPVRSSSSFRFDLECRKIESDGNWRNVRGKVQVRLFTPANTQSWAAADKLNLHYGDLIRAPVRFESPPVYQNPGSFDFRWWLEQIKDISWEGDIKSPLAVQKLSNAQASPISMLVQRSRARLLHGVDRLYPPWSPEGRVGAVLKAVLLGDRSSLDSNTVENFRQSGLYHLLVISGLHVGLLASVLLFLLYLLGVGESWRAVSLLFFLGVYSMLVEQRAPTLRASLMIAAYLLARFFYRDRPALDSVGLAALVLLVHRPAWLFEAGFDLSFSAALLITGVAIPILERTTVPYSSVLAGLGRTERDSYLEPRQAQLRLDLRAIVTWFKSKVSFLDRHPALCEQAVTGPLRIVLWVFDLLLFSAIIQVGLFMPMAETFHRITFVGIGLNALAVPLMTILIAIAVPTVILASTVPVLAIMPGRLLFWVTSTLLDLTQFRSEPFWMSYRIPGPPEWVAVGFVLALMGVGIALGRSRRLLWGSAAMFIFFGALVISFPFSPKIPRGKLEVTALDCGRGEAIFSVLPDGTTVLVNAGGREHFGPDIGRWNPGEEVVSPYLWSRGIKKINIAVLGGGANGNIDAMEAILRNFKVGELWLCPRALNRNQIALVATAREQGVRVHEMAAGERMNLRGASIQVLWPLLIPPSIRLPFSDTSPVLRLATDKDGSVLLRGNTDYRIGRILARSGGDLSSSILQCARPLSEIVSPETFLRKVNPLIVLRTAGNRNIRKGSRQAFLKGRSLPTIPVFRPSEDGAVTIDMKGSSLTIRCFGTSRVFNWRRHHIQTSGL